MSRLALASSQWASTRIRWNLFPHGRRCLGASLSPIGAGDSTKEA